MEEKNKATANEILEKYLLKIGVDQVAHTHGNFLAHLKGVSEYLKKFERPHPVLVAGLFHSIYGTESFQRFALSLDQRDEVKRMIGEEAEALVYAYCNMSYESFDKSVFEDEPLLEDRNTKKPIPVTREQFMDIQWMMMADALEVDARLPDSEKWHERVQFWKIVAEHLGGNARRELEEVYGEDALK